MMLRGFEALTALGFSTVGFAALASTLVFFADGAGSLSSAEALRFLA